MNKELPKTTNVINFEADNEYNEQSFVFIVSNEILLT